MKRLSFIVMVLLVALPLFAQQKYAVLVIDIQKFYFPGGSLPLVEPEMAAGRAAADVQTTVLAAMKSHATVISTDEWVK